MKGSLGHRVIVHMPSAAAILLTRPPNAPSTVFLGLMSVNFVRPSVLPAHKNQHINGT